MPISPDLWRYGRESCALYVGSSHEALTPGPEALMAASLLPAMRIGADHTIYHPVCPRFESNLETMTTELQKSAERYAERPKEDIPDSMP